MKMQNLKRLCAVVLSVLMIVSLVPTSVFSAECVHEYEITSWLKEATCTAKGIAKETCKLCGDTKYASITSPHTEGEPKLLEADCTNPDRISVICSVCNAELSMEAVEGGKAALGHDWGYMFPAAEGDTDTVKKYYEHTCDKEGYGVKYCKRCDQEGKNGVDSAVPALGEHTYEDKYTEATCTEPAMAGEICSVCGAAGTVEKFGEALGHDFKMSYTKPADDKSETVWAAPTCDKAGVAQIYCSVCNAVLEESVEISATGHNYEETGVVYTEATCANPAGVEVKCTACGEILVAQEEIEAHGHKIVNVAGKPACAEEGLTAGKKCSECGLVTVAQEVIPAGTHTAKLIDSYPHESNGLTVYVYKCEDCGHTTTVMY